MIFDEAHGRERGLMHAINGFIFGNPPSPLVSSGDRVRWYVTLRSGRTTDVIEVFPGGMVTADMVADNPGTWLVHCHVADHLNAGMVATYTIR